MIVDLLNRILYDSMFTENNTRWDQTYWKEHETIADSLNKKLDDSILLKRTLSRRLTEQTLDDSEQNTDDSRFTEESIRW